MDVNTFRNLNRANEINAEETRLQDVMAIINQVRQRGDAALIEYTAQFDGQTLTSLKVPLEDLKASYDQLAPDVKAALEIIRDRIVAYERQIKDKDKDLGEFTYVYKPLERVGVYVPGGIALYPSSVLMSVVAAQVAGVKEIHVTTPTFERNNITFATLYLLGVTDVYTVGGAQAVAALAYGTETIPRVDKIVGPGNAYVAAAKRLVFGDVGIDSIAGPSEILLYVDDSVNIDAIVYDLFAQAEHDVNARTYLLSESQAVVDQIDCRVQALLPDQPRREIIAQSLANNHYQIVDESQALIAVLNEIAAEHVSIQHRNQDAIVAGINYAGAVFKGQYSPEAIGDYIAGPSHVLPTNGTARYSHGLNVNDFMTSHCIINLTQATYQDLVGPAALIAETEQLFAHQASLLVRKEGINND